MGQKVNPHGIRVGINKDWDAKWFASKKDFAANLKNDNVLRTFIKKKYYQAAISRITIERAAQKVVINIFTARPGVLIGKAGAGIEIIKNDVKKFTGDKNVIINIMEVKKPDMDAQLIAESIASQLEKRMSFRRCMKQAIQRTIKAGAEGIKVMVSGRLDGAEIARSEHYNQGSIPLQTLRADIDYGFAEAHTTFGLLGVKAWVYKGEVIRKTVAVKGGNE